MQPIYRYREDVLPSLIVLGIFAIQLATFFLADSLWTVGAVMLALLACSITDCP